MKKATRETKISRGRAAEFMHDREKLSGALDKNLLKASDAPDTSAFWLQIDDLIRDCERFERERADAVNSPETLELIRRVAAELDDYDRRRAAFERLPDGIAELERLAALAELERLAALAEIVPLAV